MPKETSERFTREFNRRLGNRTNKPLRTPVGAAGRPQASFAEQVEAAMNAVATGRVKLPSKKTRGSGGSRAVKAMQEAISTMDAEERRQQQSVQAVEDAAQEHADIVAQLNEGTGHKIGDIAGTIFGKPVEAALEAISRPAYGLFNAMKEEALSEAAGGSAWENLQAGLGGFLPGITGKEKTGFGEVIEADPDTKNLPLNVKRGLGFGGELFLDPLNLATGTTASILRNTGETLGKQTLKQLGEETAEAMTRNVFNNVPIRPINVPNAAGGHSWTSGLDAAAQSARNTAGQTSENILMDIQGGAKRGAIKNIPQHAAGVAKRSAEAVRNTLLQPFEKKVTELIDSIKAGTPLSASRIQALARSDVQFAKMVDELKAGIPQNRSLEQVMSDWGRQYSSGNESFLGRVETAASVARSNLDKPIQQLSDDIFARLNGISYNTPGIRIGTKKAGKVIPLKFVGKAYGKVSRKANQVIPSLEDSAKAFSYEKLLPGKISVMAQEANSSAIRGYMKFRKDLLKFVRANKFTKEDARRVFEAMDDKVTIQDPRLVPFQQEAQRLNDLMIKDEVVTGARNPTDPVDPNYVFIYNRRGSRDSRSKFKRNRKSEIHANNTATQHTGREAKRLGLNPYDDITRSLMARKIKSMRDIKRAQFRTSLIENYGLRSVKMTDNQAKARGLRIIPNKDLSEAMRAATKEHETWYLPSEHANFLDQYNKLAKFDNTDLYQFARQIAKVTGYFKTSVTVPFPGYHNKNMIGDMFMGLLDGIPNRIYGEVLAKATKSLKKGTKTSFAIAPGIDKSWDEMVDLFGRHGNAGGYMSSETPGMFGARRVTQTIRNTSELRENFGRFSHFLGALRQESQARIAKGMDPVKALDEATEAAAYRVNHYKFDYSALTAFERKMKIAVPFYTYTRKALPTLLESLFLAPKNLSRVNRFMEYNQDGAEGAFNEMYVPEWMQEMGYAIMPSDFPMGSPEEPMAITQDVLPTNLFNLMRWEGSQKTAANWVSQVNPIGLMPFELAGGTKYYDQSKIDSLPDYLLDQIAGKKAVEGWYGQDKPFSQQLLSNRIFGGIPMRQITQGQQDFRGRQLEDELIQGPISEVNRTLDRLHVYASNRGDGYSYRVADEARNVLFETKDVQSAIRWAKGHN